MLSESVALERELCICLQCLNPPKMTNVTAKIGTIHKTLGLELSISFFCLIFNALCLLVGKEAFQNWNWSFSCFDRCGWSVVDNDVGFAQSSANTAK